MDIEKFSECCLAKVCRDNDGHVRLVVCCVLRDPTSGEKVVHRKEVNLDQLIQYAQKMFANYHQKLHQTQPEVSGSWDDMLDKSLQVAKRIGEARLIRALFAEVSPIMASNAAGVDGAESDMHKKVHEVLLQAREGNQDALDTMNALMNSAYRGNARALEIMTLMRDMNLALDGKEAVKISGINCAGMTAPELVEVGSWWSKFKSIAKVATAPVWAPAYLATKAVSKLPGGKYLNKLSPTSWAFNAMKGRPNSAQGAQRTPRIINRQRGGAAGYAADQGQGYDSYGPPSNQGQMQAAPPPYQGQMQAAPSQGYSDQGYSDPGYDQGYDQGYDDSGYGEPEFAGPQAEVSGWLYNKGYRTVAETVTSKFPGLGITMRELYHRGSDSDRALAVAPLPEPAMTEQNPIVTASGTNYVVGLSWHSLMNVAKSISKTASNVTHSSVFKTLSPILSKVAPMVASVVPGGGMAYAAAMQAHDMLVAAKKDHPEAIKAIATIRDMALGGDKKALEVASVMKNMSDKLDQKAAAAPPPPVAPTPAPIAAPVQQAMVQVPKYVQPVAVYSPPVYSPPVHRPSAPRFFPAPVAMANNNGSYYHRGLGHKWMGKHLRHMYPQQQPQVAGWLYNKPYRSALEAPGAGVVLREMYNRGEGHDPTTLSDVLKQVFPLGTGA